MPLRKDVQRPWNDWYAVCSMNTLGISNNKRRYRQIPVPPGRFLDDLDGDSFVVLLEIPVDSGYDGLTVQVAGKILQPLDRSDTWRLAEALLHQLADDRSDGDSAARARRMLATPNS